jgi:hypothetical protein
MFPNFCAVGIADTIFIVNDVNNSGTRRKRNVCRWNPLPSNG